ncbi:D-alanyl-D-alanine carboxypeptidase DacC [Armatimonadota bacterium]|nr:D-alanyl-D-alanine carboxypeptidase DacC [Armatimonadota bacterium]
MKQRLTILFLTYVLLLSGVSAWGQKTLDSVVALRAAISKILNNVATNNGMTGIVIQSLESNTTLYERSPDTLFVPASNSKILTSALALSSLGKDFIFSTKVMMQGKLDSDGVLNGTLKLAGAGDPLLQTSDIKSLAEQVFKAGVRQLHGKVLTDATRYDDTFLGEGWSWDDEPFYYAAPVSALNINENVVSVFVRPGKMVGDLVQVQIEPPTLRLTLSITAKTTHSKTKPSLRVTRQHGVNVIQVSGTLPLDANPSRPAETLTVPNPTDIAQEVFENALREQGVTIEADAPLTNEEGMDWVPIAEVKSQPLYAILQKMNKPSDNLVAECLFKAVSAYQKVQGSWGASREMGQTYFQSLGIPKEQLSLVDGSGLSRQNLVTPRNLVRVLTTLYRSPDYSVFYDSLPIAGVDGTLQHRMNKTSAENNCRAKTGSLSNVRSLSGYVTTQDGEPLVFSILMNHYKHPKVSARELQDKIVVLLANFRRQTLTDPETNP